MRTVRTLGIVATTLAALTLAAPAIAGGGLAGGGGHAGACPAFVSGDSDEVILRDSCFTPVSATATPGATVTVRNQGQMTHTYTAVDGAFDTGVLQPGDSATITVPETVGTLAVYCTLHADTQGNGMAGTLTVAASGDLAEASAAAVAPGVGSAGVALLGGLVVGAGSLAALRRRSGRDDAMEVLR